MSLIGVMDVQTMILDCVLFSFWYDVHLFQGSPWGNNRTSQDNNGQRSGCLVNASRFPPGQYWLQDIERFN